MKFSDFKYQRPDMAQVQAAFEEKLSLFENASTFEQQDQAFESINDIRTHFLSMYNICHIRHTIDTRDDFYEEENNFFDQQMPTYEALKNKFYRALLKAQFRPQLEKKWGSHLFVLAELQLKTFKPDILEDMQRENQLSSSYTKLKARAKIEFDGKIYNLSTIQKEESSKDRKRRKAAAEAKWHFYQTQAEEVENIYHQLVQTRHRIAQKLGYSNYIELGYARMMRSDYNAEMVAQFRDQIHTHIVPIASSLYERHRLRLGLDRLTYYDEDFRFNSGNPIPKGEPSWIIEKAARMYNELSPETATFFQYLEAKELMDLEAREGKATGGYCTFIGNYASPYIFSNFNGTSTDIDVLTHEAGHAFQVYSSRNIGITEYLWPTYEACEIHSMSMEFFTSPWMKLFFEEDTEKYKFSHLAGAIQFLPYGVAVDEFQHVVYANPDMSPADRNAAWYAIEKKYLPHRDYDGHSFLEQGVFWQKQSHIFSVPFYYIDYTLAQICAFQFWKRDQEDHETAWADYVKLCNAGGSKSFLDLVRLANLRSPFEDGCVASVVGFIKERLDATDDRKF